LAKTAAASESELQTQLDGQRSTGTSPCAGACYSMSNIGNILPHIKSETLTTECLEYPAVQP